MQIKNSVSGGVLLTSDWHCGLTLRGTVRDEEIKRVLDDLVDKTVQIRRRHRKLRGSKPQENKIRKNLTKFEKKHEI